MIYDIKLLNFDDDNISLNKLVDLQNKVYEGSHAFTIEGFKQWYLDNPMGNVISFNAFFNGEMVAHYACVPIKMMIDGRVVLGLLDMATVTHPDHRGKGLFTKLAKTTFEYAARNGFEFVVGVANANSYPGYMKHFPFTFISKLDVKIGFNGKVLIDKNKKFSTYWDKESLDWRLAIRDNNYFSVKNTIYGNFKPFVTTFMGSFSTDLIHKVNIRKRKLNLNLNLYIGLGAKTKGLFIKVPKFIKRSPFNLIFMDLTEGKLPPINKDNILYQLIDFDVA